MWVWETRDQLEYDRLKRIAVWKSIVNVWINDSLWNDVNQDNPLYVIPWAWWNWVATAIQNTAWGVSKSSFDYSIFHAMFTYNINGVKWRLVEDGTENLDLSTSTRAISTAWALEIKTTAVNSSYTELRSFRSPRYQPNRWHLYSTTIIYPDAETIWANFEFGLWYDWGWVIFTWVFFEITDWVIYAVVRSAWIDRVRQDITQAMTDATWLQVSDLTKGHLFDIQFQWRGVWNYFFYIDLKLVYTANFLWTLTEVTMANPQLPCFYKLKNVTAWVELSAISWCTDITSEWGQPWDLSDATVLNNGLVAIPNDLLKHHLVIVRLNENYKWEYNTRNSRLLRLTTTPFGKDMVVWFAVTRDTTAIAWTLWATAFAPINPYSSLEYIDMSVNTEAEVSIDYTKTSTAFQAASLTWNTLTANEPNSDLDLYFSAWDIIILYVANIKSWVGWEASWILEFWEEI